MRLGYASLCGALTLAAIACPGPEPHERAGAQGGGGAENGGAGGIGGSAGEGGEAGSGGAGTCGNGVVEPGELCFHRLATVSGGTNVGVGAIFDFDDDGDLDITGRGSDAVVYAFLADPAGTFGMPEEVAMGVGFRPLRPLRRRTRSTMRWSPSQETNLGFMPNNAGMSLGPGGLHRHARPHDGLRRRRHRRRRARRLRRHALQRGHLHRPQRPRGRSTSPMATRTRSLHRRRRSPPTPAPKPCSPT